MIEDEFRLAPTDDQIVIEEIVRGDRYQFQMISDWASTTDYPPDVGLRRSGWGRAKGGSSAGVHGGGAFYIGFIAGVGVLFLFWLLGL